MADGVVMALDVGGTNTRVRIALARDGVASPHPKHAEAVTRALDSTRTLLELVDESRGMLDSDEPLLATVFAFAGPVWRPGRVHLTNWPESPDIGAEELAAGGSLGEVALLNDVVAGALGVRTLLEDSAAVASGVLQGLRTRGRGAGEVLAGHAVYIAPGTGLGAATLVACGEPGAYGVHAPVACEAAHTTAGPFGDETALVFDAMTQETGTPPTWEAFISGRGLCRIHETLERLEGIEELRPPEALEARVASIARAAADGTDPVAERALDLYYRCVGRFAQLLALIHVPCTGVLLGGATTLKNREFIERSHLLEAFLASEVMGEMLEEIPFWLVLEPDVNLRGGLAYAARLASRADE